MDFTDLVTHRDRPPLMKGPLTQLSPAVWQVHSGKCPAVDAGHRPSGQFHLIGCPDCGTVFETLAATEAFSRFVREWGRSKAAARVADSRYDDWADVARFRLESDPLWAPRFKPTPYSQHVSDVKVKKLKSFIRSLWRDEAAEVFSSAPFRSDVENLPKVVLCPVDSLEYFFPQVVIAGVPVLFFNGPREEMVLVRTTEKVTSNLGDWPEDTSRIHAGSWDPSLVEESFPEMWPLALELLRNDPDLSVDEAVKSAKLVASPSS